jgi:hypothetical protein
VKSILLIPIFLLITSNIFCQLTQSENLKYHPQKRGWTNYFTDGVLRFNVTNSNSFEFEVFTTGGSLIYQNAGSVSGNPVVVWNGINSTFGWYACRITFRNNCGEKASNTYNVLSSGH